MSRFTEIILKLRTARQKQLEESQKRSRTSGKSKSPKKKKSLKKIVFDNPELQKLFDRMPDDCQDLIRKGK